MRLAQLPKRSANISRNKKISGDNAGQTSAHDGRPRDAGAEVKFSSGSFELRISFTSAGLLAIGALTSAVILATTVLVRSTLLAQMAKLQNCGTDE